MSIKATLKYTNPDELACRLVAEMTLGEWKRLRDQIRESAGATKYPGWEFVKLIEALVDQAEGVFHAEQDLSD